ncbi:hypothetical protein AB1Y20_022221 [Prymnesium parvum]|uniref:Acyl-CoA-binding domain-containing protein 6 n=1 Tax=Prymnesium parvum TaxID=97485 RepID=A0AB34JI54_PRYPA
MAVPSALEALALRRDFEAAVERLGTSTSLPPIDEAVQRRLFGLFHRATPTAPLPTAAEQLQACEEAAALSEEEAMREYVAILDALAPGDVFDSDDDAPPPPSASCLAACGAEGTRGAAGVFEAARRGAGVDAFLPAERDATDEDGLTPLHHAVDAEEERAVEALLRSGAAVDARDGMRCTPLHYAALLGASGIARRLLEAGADPLLLDDEGKDAVAIARAEGHAATADLIAAAAASRAGA